MKIIISILFFLAVSPGNLSSDHAVENKNFIQGKWYLTGTTGDQRQIAWFLEWEFKDGKFTQNGYPPLLQTGKYEVLEERSNRITVRLCRQKGTFGDADTDLVILIDRKNETLSIGGNEGFRRVNEENLE